MMLKLPFFNRERYLVLKFYTDQKKANEFAPVTLSNRVKHSMFNEEKSDALLAAEKGGSFKTCFGYVQGLKRSITIPNWCEQLIIVKDGQVQNRSAMDSRFSPFTFHQDPHFLAHPSKNHPIVVGKHNPPWTVEANKTAQEVTYIMGRSILNATPMQIPTGCLTFKSQTQVNIFNYIPYHVDYQYKIPYREPLVQIWPLSDLPLHVETYYDPVKTKELWTQDEQNPYFCANSLKLHNKT